MSLEAARRPVTQILEQINFVHLSKCSLMVRLGRPHLLVFSRLGATFGDIFMGCSYTMDIPNVIKLSKKAARILNFYGEFCLS
jgi:hypothetical protein